MTSRPSSHTVWLALATVYVVWGSTYLAIRVIVEAGLPPLLSMGSRFLAAAVLLGAVLAVTGRDRGGVRRLAVGPRQVGGCAVVGCLLLLGGNGLVAVAEQTVPSGLAALLVATVPLWLVLFRYAVRQRPSRTTGVGVLVGFAGVALLGLRGGGMADVQTWGVVTIVAASLCWAVGSFTSGWLALPADALVATVWEMALGGTALLLAGTIAGEWSALGAATDLAVGTGLVAWAYLVLFGSMLAYSAYVWLLANAPISLVATYAYVNPVVAVLLGWALLREPVTAVVLIGGALVVLGVAVVVTGERPRRESRAAVPAVPAGAAAAPATAAHPGPQPVPRRG